MAEQKNVLLSFERTGQTELVQNVRINRWPNKKTKLEFNAHDKIFIFGRDGRGSGRADEKLKFYKNFEPHDKNECKTFVSTDG
jgi:hypothetical protein